MTAISKQQLISFEEQIKESFLNKEIRCPIHLSKGNEDNLIKIFKKIKRDDWVLSTHRSHYHALLHGIEPNWVRDEILSGRSMHLMNKDNKLFCSSIVGGILPIALGIAMAIKRKGESGNVWCFVGDMGAEMGVFHECSKYAARNNLPITFVVENNHYSTNTPTQLVWGTNRRKPKIIRYSYKRGYPHVGAGRFVKF